MTQYILFEAAGLKLAVAENLVTAVHEKLTVQRVAGTCHWFSGLAVVSGKLLPVTDFGEFAGRRCCTGPTLELAVNSGIAGLRVDSVKGRGDSNTLEPGEQRGEDGPIASQILFSGKVLFVEGETHHVLDVVALVESPAFVNIRD